MKNFNTKYFFRKLANLNRKTIIIPLIITYILMIIIFFSINPIFISIRNIGTILLFLTIPGIVAFGGTLVLLGRNIDLSVGSILGLVTVVIGKLFNIENVDMPIILIILIALSIGIIIGCINGFLVTVLGINSIIVTLGTMSIFRGLAYIYAGKSLLINNMLFNRIGRGYLFGIVPIVFIYMIVIFFIFYIILKFSRFGKHLYVVGSNKFIAKLYGINVKKIIFSTFMASGFTAAIAGILISSQLSYGVGNIGLGYEFIVLTIVVLGGISIRGGRGSIVGVLIAIFIYGSISNALTLARVLPTLKDTITGMILIFAIIIDSVKNRKLDLQDR